MRRCLWRLVNGALGLMLAAASASAQSVTAVGPTSASGAQPIVWTATGLTTVDVWARPLPSGAWVNLGVFAAGAGTTGGTTHDFGSSGLQTEIWVGGNGGQVVGSAVNTAPGSPTIGAVGPTTASGSAPITWTASGVLGSVDVWTQPEGGSWSFVGSFAAAAGTTGGTTHGFGSAGQQTDIWVGANGGSVVGTGTNTALGGGGPVGGEFQVGAFTQFQQGLGATARKSVGMDADGDFVVTWVGSGNGDDVYAQRFDAAGLAQGSSFRVNSYTTGDQRFPSVASDGAGNFVVAWSSSAQDGSGLGIYAQRYDAAGTAQGAEFSVNSYTTGNQDRAAVARDTDGDFVVAWQSAAQDGNSDGIYARRYNAAGTAQGAEFRVNTHTTNAQRYPVVAMSGSGGFVVTWQSTGQDGDGDGIYAQRYDAAGAAQGTEFRANSHTTSSQQSPSVASDTAGDFVVTWNSFGQDGSYTGIYAQRYDAAGTAQGGELAVNTYTTSSQELSSVAMDADGDFVVVWESTGQDGNSRGVFGQRYGSTGAVIGAEFPVNTYTTSSQHWSSVAMDSSGNAVVAWNSFGQDVNGHGVYAQRYSGSGSPAAITNVGPTTASGSAAITWTATSIGGNVDVWARPLPSGAWVSLGAFPAAAGTTGGSTFAFGSSGQKTEVWVGSAPAGVSGSAINTAPGTPTITPTQAGSGVQPVTWTSTGVTGNVEVWVRPWPAGGWVQLGTSYPVGDGTTGSDTYDFSSGGAQTEIWIGANGGQIVGSLVYAAP